MPWWSWIVIWGVLVFALLALLAWQAVRLFSKLMHAADELGDLLGKAEALGAASEPMRREPRHPAIFADARALADERRTRAGERRRARQILRDARIQQARLLVKTDPQQFSHLVRRN
ncbi:hypothetical protein OSC27_04625 [Microbacterium sp. STN6]|uniref:hypothetical protein n=1 Tax=Microbacterium sp. STN6 TaxID=2995588 RepID=UPI002260BA46|nr:hypothetical protein [Microbacterium sp. STN6]MCX7521563.1 hypothetical protein [Microbacterium sp. STN6]